MAIGIVMGLPGCSERAAFDDLGAAVDHTGIGIGLSGECFGGLGGGSAHVAHRAEAIGGWGHLMADRVSFVDQHA